MPDDIDFDAFLDQIDSNAELSGMRVVYYDGYGMTVLREGPPICAVGLKTIVIKGNEVGETVRQPQAAAQRDSRLYTELLGGVLGCSSAALGWVVVVGGTAAVPITGGTSSFIAFLGVTAAAASSVQCGNSFVRIYNELESPSSNDWLDTQDWYNRTAVILDLIALAGAASSARETVKMALALRRSTGRGMLEVLQGLSRQQRGRVAEELIRMENPGISNGALKTMLRARTYPKRFTGLQISHAVRLKLKDAMGAALTFTGSGLSGVVHQYAAGIAQSFETY